MYNFFFFLQFTFIFSFETLFRKELFQSAEDLNYLTNFSNSIKYVQSLNVGFDKVFQVALEQIPDHKYYERESLINLAISLEREKQDFNSSGQLVLYFLKLIRKYDLVKDHSDYDAKLSCQEIVFSFISLKATFYQISQNDNLKAIKELAQTLENDFVKSTLSSMIANRNSYNQSIYERTKGVILPLDDTVNIAKEIIIPPELANSTYFKTYDYVYSLIAIQHYGYIDQLMMLEDKNFKQQLCITEDFIDLETSLRRRMSAFEASFDLCFDLDHSRTTVRLNLAFSLLNYITVAIYAIPYSPKWYRFREELLTLRNRFDIRLEAFLNSFYTHIAEMNTMKFLEPLYSIEGIISQTKDSADQNAKVFNSLKFYKVPSKDSGLISLYHDDQSSSLPTLNVYVSSSILLNKEHYEYLCEIIKSSQLPLDLPLAIRQYIETFFN